MLFVLKVWIKGSLKTTRVEIERLNIFKGHILVVDVVVVVVVVLSIIATIVLII